MVKVADVGGSVVKPWDLPTLTDWLSEVEAAPRWLYRGLLPESGMVLVSGPQKRAGKTMFALTTALAVAGGRSVGGVWGPAEAAAKGSPALIVEEEGPRAELRDRVLAICRATDTDPQKLGNVLIGWHQGVRLDEPAWRKRLTWVIREYGIKLVIFDAISYLHRCDEDSASEMVAVRDTFAECCDLGSTVMYLAHLSKMLASDKTADIDDQVRGSSMLVQMYDTHVALRRPDATAALKATLRHRGSGETQHIFRWKFESDEITGETRYAALTVESLGESNRALADRCLDRLDRDDAYNVTRLSTVWGTKGAETRIIVEALLARHAIVKGRHGYRRVL